MTVKEATEIVRLYMQSKTAVATKLTAYIELWNGYTEHEGVRVAECGWSHERGGSCYMQSDADGLAVCAAVERAILELLHDEDQEHPDYLNALATLDYLIS